MPKLVIASVEVKRPTNPEENDAELYAIAQKVAIIVRKHLGELGLELKEKHPDVTCTSNIDY